MEFQRLLLLVAMLALLGLARAADTAFMVVHKKANLKRVKHTERVNVGITLHNAGSSTAYDVTLIDDSWPSSRFSVFSGNTSTSWGKLEAELLEYVHEVMVDVHKGDGVSITRGGTVSHSFVLEARIKGPFSGAPAVVTYRVASKAALQEAFSTPLPELDILSDKPLENKLDSAKRLAIKFGPLAIVLSIVGAFIYLLVSPAKSRKFSRISKKRR